MRMGHKEATSLPGPRPEKEPMFPFSDRATHFGTRYPHFLPHRRRRISGKPMLRQCSPSGWWAYTEHTGGVVRMGSRRATPVCSSGVVSLCACACVCVCVWVEVEWGGVGSPLSPLSLSSFLPLPLILLFCSSFFFLSLSLSLSLCPSLCLFLSTPQKVSLVSYTTMS